MTGPGREDSTRLYPSPLEFCLVSGLITEGLSSRHPPFSPVVSLFSNGGSGGGYNGFDFGETDGLVGTSV